MIEINYIENNELNTLQKFIGINSNKNDLPKSQKTIREKINLPNKWQHLSGREKQKFYKMDIYKFSPNDKKNIIIKNLDDHSQNFHLTLQPNEEISSDKLKDLFAFFLSKYGYFIYGKNYPKKMKIEFILAIETQTYTHIHLLVMNMTPNEIKLFGNYLKRFMKAFLKNAQIFVKMVDDLNNLIKYIIKNENTILLTNKDFKK